MRYQNPDRVRQLIQRIPDHLYRMDYDALKIDCNSVLTSVPAPVVDFTNERFFFHQREFGGLNVIYRARLITNSDNRPHENVSEISYIPDNLLHKIENFGRVNKPRQSMFYGSLDFATACTEAITKGNVFKDKSSVMLTVGAWKFETPLKLVQMPHSEKYFKLFYDTVQVKSESIQLEHVQQLNAEARKQFETDIEFEVLQFFADEFGKFSTENGYEYKLSNYYADRIFNRIRGYEMEEEIDGIIYPSIALSYQHKNIVLKPEVVKNKMKFINAMQVWLVSFAGRGGGAQFIPIKQKIHADSDGKLLWYPEQNIIQPTILDDQTPKNL